MSRAEAGCDLNAGDSALLCGAHYLFLVRTLVRNATTASITVAGTTTCNSTIGITPSPPVFPATARLYGGRGLHPIPRGCPPWGLYTGLFGGVYHCKKNGVRGIWDEFSISARGPPAKLIPPGGRRCLQEAGFRVYAWAGGPARRPPAQNAKSPFPVKYGQKRRLPRMGYYVNKAPRVVRQYLHTSRNTGISDAPSRTR